MALSATYPEDLAKMLATYMKDPVHVRLSQDCQVRKLLTLARERSVLFVVFPSLTRILTVKHKVV